MASASRAASLAPNTAPQPASALRRVSQKPSATALEAREGKIESAMASAPCGKLSEDDVAGRGCLDEGSQHIETHDIPRTLPDGIDGHFARHPRERKLLGVAVAAQDFHGFSGQFT